MQKKNLIISFVIIGISANVLARQQLPSEMRDAADMRSQIDHQIQNATRATTAVTGMELTGDISPASTPEKEMARRRQLINNAHRDFLNLKADMRAPVGSSKDKITAPEGTGADARSPNGNEAVSTASTSRNNVPEPPRAVAVEGRVVIEGGQADARTPRDQNAGVKYSIEERFVGNLIIASFEPENDSSVENAVARGKLTPDEGASASGRGKGNVELSATGTRDASGVLNNDYQIDTISTGVRVISLGGGACVRSNGGRNAECIEQDPFTKSKISEENMYGKFNDGVVAAQREGNKIKIEVSAPDVSFSTAMSGKIAYVGCSNAVFEVKPRDFKQMVDNGSMTLTKQVGDSDQASSGCRIGSTITLQMSIKR